MRNIGFTDKKKFSNLNEINDNHDTQVNKQNQYETSDMHDLGIVCFLLSS